MGYILNEALPQNLTRGTEDNRQITQARQSVLGLKFEIAKYVKPIYSVPAKLTCLVKGT